jgi:hypothetical protein
VNRKTLEFAANKEYPFFRSISMPATVKEKSKRAAVQPHMRAKAPKIKFQADLAPSEDQMVRRLKAELEMASNSDFLADALALFRWAVSERKSGHRIVSESTSGERKVLLFPRLERVAPELTLPQAEIAWTPTELESLAALVTSKPAEPTEALLRAMRH